jgi:hypothetical protein
MITSNLVSCNVEHRATGLPFQVTVQAAYVAPPAASAAVAATTNVTLSLWQWIGNSNITIRDRVTGQPVNAATASSSDVVVAPAPAPLPGAYFAH